MMIFLLLFSKLVQALGLGIGFVALIAMFKGSKYYKVSFEIVFTTSRL